MAKRPTPKKQQAKSSSSARYNTFKNKAQKRLLNLAHGFKHSRGKFVATSEQEKAEKKMDKVTKIKA